MSKKTEIPSKKFPSPAWLLGLSFAALAAWAILLSLRSSDRAPSNPALPVIQKVEPFQLVDQNGQSFSSASLAGKVWVADFIFTRCAGPCPLMTAQMKGLSEKLTGDDIRFVSFSVDPARDTPEVLSAYAVRHGADVSRWTFLTGDQKTVFALAARSFLLAAEVEEGAAPEQAVSHSTKFVLVDPAGQIRGFYDSVEPGSLDQLAEDARSLNAGSNGS